MEEKNKNNKDDEKQEEIPNQENTSVAENVGKADEKAETQNTEEKAPLKSRMRTRSMKNLSFCCECENPFEVQDKFSHCIICHEKVHEICKTNSKRVDEENNYYCAKDFVCFKTNKPNNDILNDISSLFSESGKSRKSHKSIQQKEQKKNDDIPDIDAFLKNHEKTVRKQSPHKICAKCNLAVTNDMRILCDLCNSSFHIACANFSANGKLKCEECIKKKRIKDYMHDSPDRNTERNNALINSIVDEVFENSDLQSTRINNQKQENEIDKLKQIFLDYVAETRTKISQLEKDNYELRLQNRAPLEPRSSQIDRQPENFYNRNNAENESSLNTSSVEIMQKIFDRQIYQDERLFNRELPVVHKIGTEWLVMYKAYEKTKKLFSDSENVIRLQKSIRGDEVKKLGGPNLFSVDTYDETMHKINQMINRPQNLLRENLKEVLNIKISQDKKDRKTLIDFILAVNHFSNLQAKIGTASTRSDPTMLENIAKKLPDYLNEKWQVICIEKEFNNEIITIVHLSEFLEKKLAVLLRLQSAELPEKEKKNDDKKDQGKNNANKRNHDKSAFYNTGSNNNTNNKKPAYNYKCWVDQSDDHMINQCPKAKKMSGAEAFLLAKQLGVCTCCGKEKYSGPGHRCSKAQPPPLCRYHPNQRHWHTVCPTRPPSNREFNPNNSNNQNSYQKNNNSKTYTNTNIFK